MKVKLISKNGFKLAIINRRKAIREKCLDCSSWLKNEVKNCSFNGCKLYGFRLAIGQQNAKARKEAIHRHCKLCSGGGSKEVKKCPTETCALYAFRLSTPDRSVSVN